MSRGIEAMTGGEAIMFLRESFCLTQEELAEKSGVSLFDINRTESGESLFYNAEDLLQVIDAIGVPMSFFTCLTDTSDDPVLKQIRRLVVKSCEISRRKREDDRQGKA